MDLKFKPMDKESIHTVIHWSYEPPYDVYNLWNENHEEIAACLMAPENHYYQMLDEQDDLVAFCCFGEEGQVPGGDYRTAGLDVGLGVRPNLTGHGQGQDFAISVLKFGQGEFSPTMFRVTIASFNFRAIRVWRKLGFRHTQIFKRKRDKMNFVVLVKEP